jgi:hypothetical protein
MTTPASIYRSIFAMFAMALFAVNGFAWTLDKSEVDWDIELTQAEQAKFDIFQNAIQNDGMSPRDAANLAGDTNFKRLSDGSYQIRLSQRARVKMWINWDAQTVRIVQVGGHT